MNCCTYAAVFRARFTPEEILAVAFAAEGAAQHGDRLNVPLFHVMVDSATLKQNLIKKKN